MKKLPLLLVLCLLFAILAGCASPGEPTPEYPELPPQAALPTANPDEALPSPLCPGPQPPFITDFEVRAPPSLAQPAPRSPFRDPLFGTCLVRVTDHRADLGPEAESRGLKNEYSRVSSFNADGSYILVYGTDGEWFLYDAATLKPLGRLPLGVEPRWDAQDPNLIYYSDELRLMAYDVATGQARVVHDFAADFPGQSVAAVWTCYEGRPSMDTRYWGLMAEDGEWLPVAFVIYDRVTDTVTVRDMRAVPGIKDDVDHVTISPLGTYFLASFDRACEPGTLGDDANPCGLMVYDRDLTHGRGLLRIVGHYDAALDARGSEVIIYQDIDTDHIAMLS
ncbi:MAG: hypothetical protein L6435_18995, partial [Anaerolineae bacterium]|nr:hypothetical protein [Anaerolineae bacterium]